MTVDQIGEHARVDVSDLSLKDRKNPTRGDPKTIEQELMEGLEDVPNSDDDWGEMGLAAAACDEDTDPNGNWFVLVTVNDCSH